MIKSLSFIDDEIEKSVPKDFVEELNRVTDAYVNKRRPSKNAVAQKPGSPEEDFNMGNIKDMISIMDTA